MCTQHLTDQTISQLFQVILYESGFSGTDQQWQHHKGVDCWASHPIGLLQELWRHVICQLVFGSKKPAAAKLPPRPLIHTAVDSSVVKHPLSFYSVKMIADWCMTHGISSPENIPRTEKRQDSCVRVFTPQACQLVSLTNSRCALCNRPEGVPYHTEWWSANLSLPHI